MLIFGIIFGTKFRWALLKLIFCDLRVIFLVFFILNLFIWGQKSSGQMLRDAQGCCSVTKWTVGWVCALKMWQVPCPSQRCLRCWFCGLVFLCSSLDMPGPPRNVAARCGCIRYLPGISAAARFNICKTWSSNSWNMQTHGP